MVIKVDGNLARVEIERKIACRTCGLCNLFGKNTMITEAENNIGAEVGDRVKLEIPAVSPLKAGFILFVLPLLGLFLGYGIGTAITDSEPITICLGGAGVAFTFFTIHVYSKKVSKKISVEPSIIKIISDRKGVKK